MRSDVDFPFGPGIEFCEGISTNLLVENCKGRAIGGHTTNHVASRPMRDHIIRSRTGVAVDKKTFRVLTNPGQVSPVVVVELGHHEAILSWELIWLGHRDRRSFSFELVERTHVSELLIESIQR